MNSEIMMIKQNLMGYSLNMYDVKFALSETDDTIFSQQSFHIFILNSSRRANTDRPYIPFSKIIR